MSAALPGKDAAAGVAIDFATYHALVQLYADYASAVDSGDWDLWPEFFIDDCSYRLHAAREPRARPAARDARRSRARAC